MSFSENWPYSDFYFHNEKIVQTISGFDVPLQLLLPPTWIRWALRDLLECHPPEWKCASPPLWKAKESDFYPTLKIMIYASAFKMVESVLRAGKALNRHFGSDGGPVAWFLFWFVVRTYYFCHSREPLLPHGDVHTVANANEQLFSIKL